MPSPPTPSHPTCYIHHHPTCCIHRHPIYITAQPVHPSSHTISNHRHTQHQHQATIANPRSQQRSIICIRPPSQTKPSYLAPKVSILHLNSPQAFISQQDHHHSQSGRPMPPLFYCYQIFQIRMIWFDLALY